MDILKIGTSAGGTRPKAVIAYNEKTGNTLSYRHRVLLSARVDKNLGLFKDKNNFVGTTTFV